jgi:DNA repair exonuclease SbcCD ATPase subunit
MASELQKLSDERRQTLDRLLARLAEAEQQLRDLKAKHRARQQRYTAKRKARQAADADSRAALNEACPW